MAPHALVEILPSEWNNLLELYAQRRTESTGYNLIKNYIKWIEQEPDFNVKCFSLDGDWKSDGTFLMIVINDAKYKFVFFNTLSDNLERLTKSLICLTREPGDYKLHDYGARLLPAMEAYRRELAPKQFATTQAAWYRASKETVAGFSTEPPAGISLRSLQAEDVLTVNTIWRYGTENTLAFIKRLISYNVSVGAFDAEGKLLACCLRLPIGALGVLHVLDSHRRLGLGSLMVRCLSKKIAALDEEVLAPVVVENTASRQMFEKLGFMKIDTIYWTN
ncbi:uncharacterized protein LOC132798409 isoform X2 [Drosophila nasuta]|uniref:uncharacterized protein LOC132798409 isoform X2 n=1 Tax=Drosophila nasuta TaxID=42062 RepID=UPI00295ED394|nr:uncharacterized protein LOC132798409 isoform X2 [Drosophila nasuta]